MLREWLWDWTLGRGGEKWVLLGFVENVLLNGCVGECINTSHGLKNTQNWSPSDSGISIDPLHAHKFPYLHSNHECKILSMSEKDRLLRRYPLEFL